MHDAQPSTAALPVPPIHPAKLPLMRPKQGRWLAGVCEGVSKHLGINVAWIRLAAVVASFVSGAGVLGYILLWIFVPSGDPQAKAQQLHQQQLQAQGPLAKGLVPAYADYTGLGESESTSESLKQMLDTAPKPALFAFAGLALIALAIIVNQQGNNPILMPAIIALAGVGLSWMRYDAPNGQVRMMILGMTLIFTAYAFFMIQTAVKDRMIPVGYALGAGIALLLCTIGALVPWIVSLVRNVGTERALKEREEERADMTAHLHDGVLQTLALIQLNANDPQQVFALARSQERELRSWLYQERVPTDRSVSSGLREIAAEVEDRHGKAVDVVTVGDAQPSAQTDALLDAARQAIVNAVLHGAEPISVYCEAGENQVEVFVRDHGSGFDIDAIPPDRLGIRESIIGRIKRRGGTVEIVSRANWGTEVRMHMPVAELPASS